MNESIDHAVNPRADKARFEAWRARHMADPEFAEAYRDATEEIERIDELVRTAMAKAKAEGHREATAAIVADLRENMRLGIKQGVPESVWTYWDAFADRYERGEHAECCYPGSQGWGHAESCTVYGEASDVG